MQKQEVEIAWQQLYTFVHETGKEKEAMGIIDLGAN